MTTALVGKQEQLGMRARVALVSRGSTKNLAALLARAGHDIVELEGWSELTTAAAATALDLVVFDADQAAEVPRGLAVPAVQVGERTSSPAARSLGCISASALESALDLVVNLAIELRLASSRCRELERLVEGVRNGSALVGTTPVMRRLQSALSRAADSDATVLIEGPRGAGKSLAGRVIHCKSRRCGQVLEVRECADLDTDGLTQALITARASTLLLEGVERLSAPAQAVLVRHMKEKAGAQSNGSARLIVTTSAHLPELVAKGAFREDLYYRLHTFPILVPSLRERSEDIPAIAMAVLDGAVPSTGKPHQGLTQAAIAALSAMTWVGNVAQLETMVRRAQTLAGGAPIDREHLTAPAPVLPVAGAPATAAPIADEESDLDEDSIRPFEEEEQNLLSRALRATKGNVRRAAQLLGIGRATLYRKIQQYKLRLQ